MIIIFVICVMKWINIQDKGSYDKMNTTTWSSMKIITSKSYHVNWDMYQWWRIYSYIEVKLVDVCGIQNDKPMYCEWEKVVYLCIVSYLEKLVIRNGCDVWWFNKQGRNDFYSNNTSQYEFKRALVNKWMRSKDEFQEAT